MTEAQIMVVDGRDDLEELLRKTGIDLEGRRVIPLCIPINSLDEIPTVLSNLGRHAEKISGQITAELNRPDPEEELASLRQENTILKAKLEGVGNALGIKL